MEKGGYYFWKKIFIFRIKHNIIKVGVYVHMHIYVYVKLFKSADKYRKSVNNIKIFLFQITLKRSKFLK